MSDILNKIADDLPMSGVRAVALEYAVEMFGQFVKIGRFLRIRFVWDRNGLPDVPDAMLWGEFRRLAGENKTKIIIDDEGGGVKVKTPELV